MSATNEEVRTPAPTRTETVLVERANDGGVMAGGRWYNYGRVFKREERPAPEEVTGRQVELTLVQSTRDGRWYVRTLKDAASPEPVGQVEEAAPTSGFSNEDLEKIRSRFGKPLVDVTVGELVKWVSQ